MVCRGPLYDLFVGPHDFDFGDKSVLLLEQFCLLDQMTLLVAKVFLNILEKK